jgi:hypothetical protein
MGSRPFRHGPKDWIQVLLLRLLVSVQMPLYFLDQLPIHRQPDKSNQASGCQSHGPCVENSGMIVINALPCSARSTENVTSNRRPLKPHR